MNQTIVKAVITVFALSGVVSCTSTQEALSGFKPYVYVVTNGKDPEPLLKELGEKYYCEDGVITSDKLNKACCVEKSLAHKTMNSVVLWPPPPLPWRKISLLSVRSL